MKSEIRNLQIAIAIFFNISFFSLPFGEGWGGAMAQTNIFPASGNAGIGTTSPSQSLEVIGTIKADTIVFPDGTFQATAPADSFLSIKIGTNTLYGTQNGFTKDDGDLHLQTTDTVYEIRFCKSCDPFIVDTDTVVVITNYNTIINGDNSGNVGIGTMTPTQKLTVNGTVESIGGGFKFPDGSVQTTAASGGGAITTLDSLTVTNKIKTSRITSLPGDSLIHLGDSSIIIDNFNHHLYTATSFDIYGNVFSSPNFYIQSLMPPNKMGNVIISLGGKSSVGIGKNIPLAKLDVLGGGLFSENVGIGTTSANAALDVNGDGLFSGNVAIGTTTVPSGFKLAVCGKIKATEVEIDASAWCDYVFEPNYKTMKWNDKLAYIKKNKHLPGIASGKDIEANGLKTAETMKGIMLNVEENTLDIIELYKMNENLMKIIKQQNAEIEELKKKLEEK